MDSFELLKKWPGWGNANAEKVFASPAWRLEAEYDGEACEIRKTGDLSDLLWMDIRLDDIPHGLGLADSESYGDLHLLWSKRAGLPAEVLLALVEKECGELFQTLENAARKSLEVKGVALEPSVADPRVSFGVFAGGSASPSATFALTLSPALAMAWGQLRFIDTAHPAIRSLTVEATPHYSSVMLSEDDAKSIRQGDSILLSGEEGKWTTGFASIEGFAVIGAEKGMLTFEQLADDSLPPVPQPDALKLVRGDATIAEGVFSSLVGNPVMSVTKTANEG